METEEMLAEAFGTSVEEVREIEDRAWRKVEEARNHHVIFLGYEAVYPEDGKTFDYVLDPPR